MKFGSTEGEIIDNPCEFVNKINRVFMKKLFMDYNEISKKAGLFYMKDIRV